MQLKQFDVHEYEGVTGRQAHITRTEYGMMPTGALARLHGAKGELPGQHEHYRGRDWEDFKQRIAPGIQHPVFITVDHGQSPRISEGNNRRDAAVELGRSHIPVEVRYFGHAERQGTVFQRWQRQQQKQREP